MFPERAVEFREGLLTWSRGNLREFPWREPERRFYEVLMSEFFLARTRAVVVARVIPEFLQEFPDLPALREADEDQIAEVIRPTGLQNRRAEALKELAQTVDGNTIPRSAEELRELPRVGEYVAHATMCFGLGKPYFIRDTNVNRIFERILGDDWPEADSEKAELLSEVVPEDEPERYNLALLDFGAEICTAQSPQCEECFASDYCLYYADGKKHEEQ